MFLGWIEANRQYLDDKHLTYVEFPSKFVNNKDSRNWQPRKKGFSIGRLHYIPR